MAQKVHYQEKFITLEEAKKDAKTQSLKLKQTLYVIQSRQRLFYVDSNASVLLKNEVLVKTYKDGKVFGA